jgi:uncharacterized lipoprotein YajG
MGGVNFRSPIFALAAILSVAGCSLLPQAPHPTTVATTSKAVKPNKPAAPTAPTAIVTPDFSLAAKVISVNEVGRFVVLSFPASQMPKLEQTLFLYRTGLKTAEVRVTGPQQDNNIVADLVSGDARIGDTVSEK